MASKSRRRSLIVALLIFVLVAAVWLLTPRVDPRLVGEWINVDPAKFAAHRQFNADGTHRYAADASNPLLGSGGEWSVSRNTLTFTQRPLLFTGAPTIRHWVYNVINRIRLGAGTEYYDLLEVTPDTLRIHSQSGAPIEDYRRKP